MSTTASRQRFFDLLVAGSMAFLAGATDLYGFGLLHGTYVSFMSGNTTMLGMAMGAGDWAKAGLLAQLIALFVAGAAAGVALGILAGRHRAAAVAAAVAVALAVPVGLPDSAASIFVPAMGALNAAMSRVGEATVGLTYVTGGLVKLGQGLGLALCGHPGNWAWLLQAPTWLCFLAGAATAAVVRIWLGNQVLWPLPTVAACIALGVFARGTSYGAEPMV